jgi:CheY-like chemotaxis protein
LAYLSAGKLLTLLGGEIQLVSSLGQGSTFTLYLPQTYPSVTGELSGHPLSTDVDRLSPARENYSQGNDNQLFAAPEQPVFSLPGEINDDREAITPGDRVLLIIEDDLKFAQILLDRSRAEGFKGLVALRSDLGLAMAREFKPDAIMLDIRLPVMDGWTVLDRLKHDPITRHIPVHILSVEEGQQRSLHQGAIAYLKKPVASEALTQALVDIKAFIERQVKQLLVVEDDEVQRQSIVELIGSGDVQTTTVASGTAALAALKAGQFDCVVLDLGLPDMSGLELIEQIKQEPSLLKLPIIVYTGQDLTPQAETQLKRLAETIIIKDVRSPERLLDETTLFLHRVQSNLPQPQRQMLEQFRQTDSLLAGKKVLIIDDDVRNIFALTSLLERHQMEVLYAENGRDGIAVLQSTSGIDVVFMDVMMPEMDGYETMQAIRQIDQFRSLPMIALTAKAMKGDREKCIAAGASDYITKPVDTEQLLSLLRVWLYK